MSLYRAALLAAITLLAIAGCSASSTETDVAIADQETAAEPAVVATTAPLGDSEASAAASPTAAPAATDPDTAAEPEPADTARDVAAPTAVPADTTADTTAETTDDTAAETDETTAEAAQSSPVPTAVLPPLVPEPTAEAAAPLVVLPAVDVVNLATGQNISLADYSSSEATLLWFWAPH